MRAAPALNWLFLSREVHLPQLLIEFAALVRSKVNELARCIHAVNLAHLKIARGQLFSSRAVA